MTHHPPSRSPLSWLSRSSLPVFCFFAVFALLVSITPTGCGGSPQEATNEPAQDASGTPDTSAADKGAADTSQSDTNTTPDPGKPDTGKPDATTPDTNNPTDAGAPDTSAPDLSKPDATPDTKPDEGKPEALSYAKHIKDLFTRANCTNGYCHGGGSGGLVMKEGVTYGNLVNKKSTKGTWTRVVPGDPEKSLLYEKITKEKPAEGSKMPIGSTLTEKNIALIRDWIKSGAKP